MSSNWETVEVACPAKVNLTLAVLGQQEDGFHKLESIVAQTEFGDDLTLSWTAASGPEADTVSVEGTAIPEEANSVLRAIQLFREQVGFRDGRYHAMLRKRIPVGAGLGGGSSDAVATLKALQQLHPERAGDVSLATLAGRLGSDCSLFLKEYPVLIRGRGEQVEILPATLQKRLSGLPLILFKPAFSIATVEAYRRLAAGGYYTTAKLACEIPPMWEASGSRLPTPHNDFERLIADWIPSLSVVLSRLRGHHGIDARLSGSGSACLAFSEDPSSARDIILEEAERAWGGSFEIYETYLKSSLAT